MEKVITLSLVLFLSFLSFSQTKYLTKTGIVSFEASVPSFEEVKATTASTTVILNTDNGEFAALIFVKGFRFKNALMEEHFNENYAESDIYPKATFKGQLTNFNLENISEVKQIITYSGRLEFHGKTKMLENLELSISASSTNIINLEGEFEVNTDDFDIEIPKVVSNKLSKTVSVKFAFELKKR